MYVCIAYPSVVLRILIFASSDDMYLFAIICLFDIHSYVFAWQLGFLFHFVQKAVRLLRSKAVELVLEHCKALQPELRREEHGRTAELYELSMLQVHLRSSKS